jgi:cellobiose phosphorylase
VTEGLADSANLSLTSPAGLTVRASVNGALQRFDCGPISLLLFLGNEVEGGPANLYLRRHGARGIEWTPLLGPRSATTFRPSPTGDALRGSGSWGDIEYSIALVLAKKAPAWFWHVKLDNTSSTAQQIDLTYTQDLALAHYGAVRLNEFYVSQYVDHTPLSDAEHGVVIASRQNQAADGRYPWCLIGSLRKGVSFATDALQFHGLASRSGDVPVGLTGELPGRRLQHEHSMVVLRDERMQLPAKSSAIAGFFGSFAADHPEATSPRDLDRAREILALPEAPFGGAAGATGPQSPGGLEKTALLRTPLPPRRPAIEGQAGAPTGATIFSHAPVLEARDLESPALRELFPPPWRHEERDERDNLLSFFHGEAHHVVLRSKELRVQRPHGHLLRTGRHLTPDESALTSTAWMSGVFHSMVTQGHVSINRFLSTVHTYLGLFRSHGQRVFVELDGQWRLLNVPSAFEMTPNACRWLYRHAGGIIEVRAEAHSDPHALTLSIETRAGAPARFLISHHVALNGDDGSAAGAAKWRREGSTLVVTPAPDGDVGRRFPSGSFLIEPAPGTEFQSVGGDELLYVDGRTRQQPFVCAITAPTRSVGLRIRGDLIAEETQAPLRADTTSDLMPKLSLRAGSASNHAQQLTELSDIAPWFTHNALVHYLSPRGLEQYSGGGWGTRDLCQGPVEMLLALGRFEPVRDLLLRVMAQQNADGDWPQWFMFFDRERNIRPGDSHGDIVFWPLLVLGQYLIVSGDAGVLDERAPFFDSRGADAAETATVWQHAERALTLIQKRVIPGTSLAAYGHGDWNDSLQPADPVMRERLCSAWTVTLHFQILKTLAHAFRAIGRTQDSARFEQWSESVLRDFQRLLLADGVLTGYALFDQSGKPSYLLHPSDKTTGVRYSALAMIHAILEDMLTPQQSREHLRLIDAHLSGPDGVRLFDRPLPYHGGPQRLFQRAESATFFGREIGLMYTHAHLRYAQALAHVGDVERFFRALCQANPIGIRALVPSATLRQANCYYSSSDAAFDDRYQASAEYERVADGTIPLDGGWRVYSSGAGIALGLIVRRFFGLNCEAAGLSIDPVIPSALDGLTLDTVLLGRPVLVHYRIGASGCGVKGIALNGVTLPFDTRANPHRRGAAAVPVSAVLERLTESNNTLTIDLG